MIPLDPYELRLMTRIAEDAIAQVLWHPDARRALREDQGKAEPLLSRMAWVFATKWVS